MEYGFSNQTLSPTRKLNWYKPVLSDGGNRRTRRKLPPVPKFLASLGSGGRQRAVRSNGLDLALFVRCMSSFIYIYSCMFYGESHSQYKYILGHQEVCNNMLCRMLLIVYNYRKQIDNLQAYPWAKSVRTSCRKWCAEHFSREITDIWLHTLTCWNSDLRPW